MPGKPVIIAHTQPVALIVEALGACMLQCERPLNGTPGT
jgi:hypothetical protein